ncbi:hypothetical protein MN608_10679 [Microdochium nivale]|nr:hypothetical protein MN608_10679 [Microdochium nivale]
MGSWLKAYSALLDLGLVRFDSIEAVPVSPRSCNLTGSFHKLYKQTVSASGSLSIFGLSMSLGPKAGQNAHQIS